MSTRIVQVTNIAPQATREHMSTLFGYLGKLEDIQLYPNDESMVPLQPKVCYVKYVDAVSVGLAQHLTNTVFIDRAVIVVPYTDSSSIPDEDKGLAISAGLTPQPTPAMPSNLINQVQTLGGSQVITTVDHRLTALGLPQYPPLPANMDPSKIEEIRRTVYVGNLDSAITAEQLLNFFNQVGEVKYVRMAGDDMQPTRFSFVEFTDQTSVAAALQYNGVIFGGRPLKVNHSNNAIVKPQAKSNEAAQREIEEAMKRVREAQSLITAAIEPELVDKKKSRSRSRSRSRRRSRSSSRRRRSRSRHRSRSRRRSHSRKRSRSRSRRTPKRSRSRDRRSSSRSKRKEEKRRSKSPRKKSRSRSKEHSRHKSSRKSKSTSPSTTRKSSHSKDKDKERSKSTKDKKSSSSSSAEGKSRKETSSRAKSNDVEEVKVKLEPVEEAEVKLIEIKSEEKVEEIKAKSPSVRKKSKSPAPPPVTSSRKKSSRSRSRSPRKRTSRPSPARRRSRSGSRPRRRVPSRSPPPKRRPSRSPRPSKRKSRSRSRSPASPKRPSTSSSSKHKKEGRRRSSRERGGERKGKERERSSKKRHRGESSRGGGGGGGEEKGEKVAKEVKVRRDYDEEEKGYNSGEDQLKAALIAQQMADEVVASDSSNDASESNTQGAAED